MARRISLILFVFVTYPVLVFGQFYFGKNKVQYSDFDWQILTTEHFTIYFYREEEEVAKIAAALAESSYTFLANKFNHHIFRRTPLIIYSSPHYFEQTNVVAGLLPENVAGFTEFFKGRVVLPYHGSYSEFSKVLRHEIVHVFTFDKLSVVLKAHRKVAAVSPPLWFTEGLAEYWSRPEETGALMILKDLIIGGHLITLDNIHTIQGTYLMYKEGESFLRFLGEVYNDERILLLFENWWQGKDFSEIVQQTYGKSLGELGREWEYWLKKRFFPGIASQDLPDKVAHQLTRSGFNVKACPVRLTFNQRTDDWVVFKANKLGYSGLYLMPLAGEKKKLITLVKGERSRTFESLHLLQSDIDVSADNRVVFASKNNERDFLYVYDLNRRKITEALSFESLIVILSPAWSLNGKKIVFTGVNKCGKSDLYIYNLDRRNLLRLTADIYEDSDPAFAPDGKLIVFSSDRGTQGQSGSKALYIYDLTTGVIIPKTGGGYHDVSPTWSPDGQWILFTSDREGSANLFAINDSGQVVRLTNILSGAFDGRYLPDGKRLVFTAFKDLSFHIFESAIDSTLFDSPGIQPLDTIIAWYPDTISGSRQPGFVKYKNDYSFDLAQSAIAYDNVFGTVGGFQMALTDMLGNHQFYFLLSNEARTRQDFLSSFNVGATYVNKTHRINFGLGAYHFYDEYFDDYDGYVNERQIGGLTFATYPISKFQRLEASFYLRNSNKGFELFQKRRNAILATNHLSLIQDNSLWDIVGPIDGHRYNLTVGLTTDLGSGRIYNRVALGDLRKYFRLGRYSAFALRGLGFASSGLEPLRLYLGGSWSLRGYSRRAFYGRQVVLGSIELRFPLIDKLFIRFPVGQIGFQAIRGALFFDAGNAWNDQFNHLNGSFGFGARVSLGYFVVLRFDLVRTTDFRTIAPDTKFDFFFGWNF